MLRAFCATMTRGLTTMAEAWWWDIGFREIFWGFCVGCGLGWIWVMWVLELRGVWAVEFSLGFAWVLCCLNFRAFVWVWICSRVSFGVTMLCFRKARNDKALSYWAQRSIHEFKVRVCVFKAWIFYLKFKVCLKFCGYFANAQYDNMDFSLVLLAQNDKNEFLPWFLPCNPLGRYT